MKSRSLCSIHPNVDYKKAWGCPDCLATLRTALRKIQTHQGFDKNNCAMKPYDVLCECQRWAEEALSGKL